MAYTMGHGIGLWEMKYVQSLCRLSNISWLIPFLDHHLALSAIARKMDTYSLILTFLSLAISPIPNPDLIVNLLVSESTDIFTYTISIFHAHCCFLAYKSSSLHLILILLYIQLLHSAACHIIPPQLLVQFVLHLCVEYAIQVLHELWTFNLWYTQPLLTCIWGVQLPDNLHLCHLQVLHVCDDFYVSVHT